jgi:hypothetical protein
VTTQPGKTQEELSPLPLMRILGDFANSQTLDAALEYDFFTLIHKGLKRRTKSLAKPGPTHEQPALFSTASSPWRLSKRKMGAITIFRLA